MNMPKLLVAWFIFAASVATLPAPSIAQDKTPVSVMPNIGDLTFGDKALVSPNGQLLAVSDGSYGRTSGITLWNISVARPLRMLQYHGFFRDFAFTPDGATIVSGHKDGAVNVWNVANGDLLTGFQNDATLDPGDRAVESIWIDETGATTVVGDEQGGVSVWSIGDRKRLHHVKVTSFEKDGTRQRIVGARLSAKGDQLIAATEAGVRILDLAGNEVQSFELPKNHSFFAGSIVGEGEFVALYADPNCKVGRLVFVDLTNRGSPVQIDKPDTCERSASDELSRSHGEPLVVAKRQSDDVFIARWGIPGIVVWNKKARTLIQTFRWQGTDDARVIAFADDLGTAIAQDGARVRAYELTSGTLLKELAAYGYDADVALVSSSGQDLLLAREQPKTDYGQKVVELWRVDTIGSRKVQLPTDGETTVMDFSVAAGLVLAVDAKNDVLLYSSENGRALRKFAVKGVKEISRVRLSPDGKLALVVGEDANKRTVETRSVAALVSSVDGSIKASIRTRTADDHITAAAFSKDGSRFAVGRRNGTAEVWDTRKGQRLVVLPADKKDDDPDTHLLQFSDDGQTSTGEQPVQRKCLRLEYTRRAPGASVRPRR